MPLKTYIKYSQLAAKLGYRGKRAPEAARKFVARRSIPKRWRDGAWVVAEEDVQRSLDGHSFVRLVQQQRSTAA